MIKYVIGYNVINQNGVTNLRTQVIYPDVTVVAM